MVVGLLNRRLRDSGLVLMGQVKDKLSAKVAPHQSSTSLLRQRQLKLILGSCIWGSAACPILRERLSGAFILASALITILNGVPDGKLLSQGIIRFPNFRSVTQVYRRKRGVIYCSLARSGLSVPRWGSLCLLGNLRRTLAFTTPARAF